MYWEYDAKKPARITNIKVLNKVYQLEGGIIGICKQVESQVVEPVKGKGFVF
jgi:predicted sulfurtransferase